MSATTAVNEFKIEKITRKWANILKIKKYIVESITTMCETATVTRGDVKYEVRIHLSVFYTPSEGIICRYLDIGKHNITSSDEIVTDKIEKKIAKLIKKKYKKMGLNFDYECECDDFEVDKSFDRYWDDNWVDSDWEGDNSRMQYSSVSHKSLKIKSLTQKWYKLFCGEDGFEDCIMQTPETAIVTGYGVKYHVRLLLAFEFGYDTGLLGGRLVIKNITGNGEITEELKQNILELIKKQYTKEGCCFGSDYDSDYDSDEN